MTASRGGHENIVRLLLDRGADVNMTNDSGNTALIWASNINVVRLLLDRGANVNARNTDGGTALIYCSREGHENRVRLLLDRGANVNAHVHGVFTEIQP